MTLKIGIIGTGVMGGDHARRVATGVSGARVVAVSDPDTGRAERVAGAAGGARVHADGLALVGDAEVEAVLVASPPDTHEAYALACVAAGKPVLCEKPLAPTAGACLRVVEAEAAAGGGRLVQVGFMRRYDEGYLAVKAALDGGLLGRPLLVHCVHRNAGVGPGFTGGTIILDSVVHEIDAARWLLGQEIAAATVLAPRRSALAPEGLDDPQLVLLETGAGVLVDVEIFVSCQYGYDVRCEVVGERGTVSLPEPAEALVRRQGLRARRVSGDWRRRFAGAYRGELQAWVDGAARGGIAGPSAWDGYAATAAAQACMAAVDARRRTTVELAPRPGLYA
ncbi:MAG TPA: Gfo/Idh/MocA family oxidoreductase [Actinomycetes bacterium]|nr:Gfo/Idh/MocA family oxidoreductase [Actinomycetes bacterium]